MRVSYRNYEKLLIPALIISIGFHLLAAFVPEGAVRFAIGSRELPSPAVRFQVLALAPEKTEKIPVYVEKNQENASESSPKVIEPALPEFRLSSIQKDSLARIEVFAQEIAQAEDALTGGPDPHFTQTNNPDSLVEISSYLAVIFNQINRSKRYPEVSRRFGQQGEVEVGFALCSDGSLDGETFLVAPCPYGPLNRSAQQSVERASPFPPLPHCVRKARLPLKLRIVFQLND